MPHTRASKEKAWDREQRNLYNALTLLGSKAAARNVLFCGHQYIRYHCPSCGADTDLPFSCRNRLCPRCSIARAAKFIARHRTALAQMHSPRLLTLTIKSLPHLTPEALTKLTRDFAKLRRRKLWTSAVSGGIAGTEFTWNPSGWHPHYHALLDGRYIPIKLLSNLWHTITGDSMIVYLQACTPSEGVYEVAKYVAKGSSFYSHKELVHEYLTVTKGRRFFTTFGTFYRALDPRPPLDGPTAKDLRSMITYPPRLGWPLIATCPHCHDQTLECRGHVTDDQIQPKGVQIPF